MAKESSFGLFVHAPILYFMHTLYLISNMYIYALKSMCVLYVHIQIIAPDE